MTPEIHAVEPPSWWRGSTLTSLRLLLRGKNLHGVKITVGDLPARDVKVSRSGAYAFVEVALPARAPAGVRTVRAGDAAATFTLTPGPARRLGNVTHDDVLYLILPDRFCDGDPARNRIAQAQGLYDPKRPRHYHGGDLEGIRQKLGYLQDLGATALWLTPIYQNARAAHPTLTYAGEPAIDYHGYGAIDFYAVDERFGDPDALRRLIRDAHARGIKMVQDQVANHTGPAHPWTLDPPTPRWIHPKRDNDWRIRQTMNPHASPAVRAATLDGWFAGVLPDLNQDDPECARYLIQNALWWVGTFGFDVVRQDTVPYVPRSFWARWSDALAREFPDVGRLGEVKDEDPALVSFFMKGRTGFDGIDAGFDRLFDFPLHDAAVAAFTGRAPLERVADALARDGLYPDPTGLVTLLGLHDTPRFLGMPSADDTALRLAAMFLLTCRGIPLWYYADEIGMAGGDDPDNRRHFPGGFPGDPRDAFTHEGRTERERALLGHVRSLMRLRQRVAPLRRGALTVLAVERQQLVYARTLGAETVLVALNNDTRAARLKIDLTGLPIAADSAWLDALAPGESITARRNTLSVAVPARTGRILSQKMPPP